MTTVAVNALFLGVMTYLVHSSIFLLTAWGLTSLKVIKNLGLKELIWRLAMFAGIFTSILQLSGSIDPLLQPIGIPERAAVAERPFFEPTTTPDASAAAVTKTTKAADDLGALVEKPGLLDKTQQRTDRWSAASLTMLVWAIFGIALLLQLGMLIINLRSRLSGRCRVSDPRVLQLLFELAAALEVRPPKISMKRELAGPFCLASGEIVIPAWVIELPEQQLRALLAHELAHHKRHDPQWLIVGRVIQGVLFFQPLNVVANRELVRLAEFACDAWSKKQCKTGLALVECLAQCARRQFGHTPAVLVMAMASSRSSLIERSQVLLENVRDHTAPVPFMARLAIAAVFLSTALVFPSFALDKSAAPAKRLLTEMRADSSHVSIDSDGYMRLDIEYLLNDRKLKVKGKGRFGFNTEETAMTSISEDGFLDIEDSAGGNTRRVRFSNREGAVATIFWLNGEQVASDRQMQDWLGGIIGEFYRLTGLDAEARTRRIFERGGVQSVLDEMALIPGSYTFRKYAATLLELVRLGDQESIRFLKMAAATMSSYDLRETLAAYTGSQSPSDMEWAAFAAAAASVTSSYDLRETLLAASDSFSGPTRNWRTLLQTAGNISSSYDLRMTLTGFVHKIPKDDAVIELLAATAQKVSSNYDLRETLSAYAGEGGYSTAGWLALLGAARDIGSDYDLRSTLIVIAAQMPRDEALVSRYRAMAAEIRSRHDRKQAESAL